MNKIKLTLVILLGNIIGLSAQSKYPALDNAAAKIVKSIVDYDIDTYSSLILPSIIEMSGGIESYKSMTKSYKDQMVSAGMMVIEGEVDTISHVAELDNELQCFVTISAISKFGENYFQGPIFLLAVSVDNGESWTFVDLETFDEAGLKDFVPSYDAQKLPYPVSTGMLVIERK